MTVLAVVNRKGGVGKTTTAVNLAHGLAMRIAGSGGGRVLLIDMDPQGDAAAALGLDPEDRCISNILTGQSGLRENVLATARPGLTTRENLYLLPASDRLRDAIRYLQAQSVSVMVMQQTLGASAAGTAVSPDDALVHYLGPAKKIFTYIVVDCPPSLGLLDRAVYKFVDKAIVPVRLDVLGMRGTGRHTQNILAEQDAGINVQIAAVVPTFVRQHLKLSRSMADLLSKTYGRHLISRPIPERVSVEEAPADGVTMFEYEPDGAPAKAYWALVDRIHRGSNERHI